MVSLALQQVQGNVTEDRKVLRPLVFANATVVFPERPIQHPMQRIFQIPPDLVVKLQAFDMVDVILWSIE
jgi:hypothetical protein